MAAAIRDRTPHVTMIELIRTNDLVLIGFAESLLAGADMVMTLGDRAFQLASLTALETAILWRSSDLGVICTKGLRKLRCIWRRSR